jgi:hypothetical protein
MVQAWIGVHGVSLCKLVCPAAKNNCPAENLVRVLKQNNAIKNCQRFPQSVSNNVSPRTVNIFLLATDRQRLHSFSNAAANQIKFGAKGPRRSMQEQEKR